MRATEYLSEVAHNGVAEETLEQTIVQIPTNALVGAALVSIGISLTFKLMGQHRHAEFVGQWAPTFVGLAVLRKLIAHDKHDS
ncbi:MAG TPA: hypothetical protein VF595_13870 [Tepidisphaeraceae bacterium]|jgi:hypothetical protein